MNPSPNLFLIGATGAGKSTLGAWLAPRLQLALVDLDRLIEARAGRPVHAIFDGEGEAGFRAREAQALAEYCTGSGLLLIGGAGIVTAAGNRERLRRHGFVLRLDIDAQTLARRLQGDASRPLLAGGDMLRRLRRLDAEREALYAATCDAVLRARPDETPAALGARALELLAHCWQRRTTAGAAP